MPDIVCIGVGPIEIGEQIVEYAEQGLQTYLLTLGEHSARRIIYRTAAGGEVIKLCVPQRTLVPLQLGMSFDATARQGKLLPSSSSEGDSFSQCLLRQFRICALDDPGAKQEENRVAG